MNVRLEREGLDDELVLLPIGDAWTGRTLRDALCRAVGVEAVDWEVVWEGEVPGEEAVLECGDGDRVVLRPTRRAAARAALRALGYRGGGAAEWDGWFIEALRDGALDAAALLVDAGMVSPEALWTQWSKACGAGDLDPVLFLTPRALAHPPPGPLPVQPLANAVAAGHADLVAHLLARGGFSADAAPGVPGCASMLALAASQGGPGAAAVCGALVDRGASWAAVDVKHVAAAVRNGDVDVLQRYLVQGGPREDRLDDFGVILHAAACRGNAAAAAALLAAGADPDGGSATTRGAAALRWHTPLMSAAAAGDVPVCRVLLDAGAALNAVDFYGKTALGRAAGAAVDFLRERGATQ